MARFTVPPLRLIHTPTITPRAGKVNPYVHAGQLVPIAPDPGLNQPETRVAHALTELNIYYIAQQSFLGGSILGGARSDYTLPDYGIVLLVDGPFHRTDYGLARDVLVDATYRAAGYSVIHFSTDLVDANLKQHLLDAIGVPLEGAAP